MIARNSRSLIQNTHRSFSIATPIQRLHFIDHPRYGKVYPVVTLNQDTHYRKTAMSSTVMLTLVNTSILYSTFINQIFTAAFSAIFANPIFLLPSLAGNYILWRRSAIYFYGDRAEVVNMFLKPNGKQVVVETRDGESKVINNTDIYEATKLDSKYD